MKLLPRVIVLLFCVGTVLTGRTVWAQVQEAQMTADGTGVSREAAIQAALVQAAAQAFGIDLNASTETLMTAVDVATGADEQSVLVSSLNRQVTQRLRTPQNAPILGYSVDHAQPLAGAGWEARVTLRYAQFERLGADTDRRSIVVIGNHPQYAQLLRETVGASLIGSRRFDVLDRANSQLFDNEKSFILGDDAATAEMARLSQATGADYLVIAEIANLGIRNNQRETIRMTGEVLVQSSISGTLRLQIVEFASRKVKWTGSQNFGGTYQGVSQIGRSTVQRLLTQASKSLVDAMVASIYPIRVVKVVGNTAVINRGEGGVAVGETYTVFMEGEELIDPQSGESLGSMEMEVGKGRVTEVKPKFALIRMTSGSLEPEGSYLLRKSEPRPTANTPRAPARPAPQRAPAEPSRKDAFLNN